MDDTFEALILSPAPAIPADTLAKILFGKPIPQVVKDMQADPNHPLLRPERDHDPP